ncbi:MAG: hypothetical protein H6510_16120 [Acidobacteria bacterium]|nr:hypothetical protein [Acidobacteriota bacterium]
MALCMGFGQTDHLLVIIQENQQRLYRLDLNSGAWQEVEQTKLGLLYAQNFWPMDAQGTRLMFSNTKKGFVVDGALKVESNQKQGQITALTETGFYALSTGALFDLKDNLLFESRDNLLVPGPNGKAFLLLQNTGTHFDKRFAPFVLSLPEKRKVAKFPFEVAASELLQAFYFDDLGEYFYFLDHSGFLLRAEKVPGRN